MTIQTIKFSEMTSGGNIANNEMVPGIQAGGNVLFNFPWTFLPPGTTAQRPIPAAEMYYLLRLNTDLQTYEYFNPTVMLWVELSGSGTGTVNPGNANSIAFYASTGTTLSPISSVANAVLITSALTVPSFSTTLPPGLAIPTATITNSTAALVSGQVSSAPVNPTDLTNKTYVDTQISGVVTSITGTTNQIIASSATGAVTLSLPQDIALGSTPTFAGLTLTSIPLDGASGGTGVNNGSHTITLAGNLATSGAFASTFTMTGATNVTFPTSGTLATVAGTVSSITGTANQIAASASTGAVTLSIASNPVLPGTGGVTLPKGNTAQQAGAAGTMRFNTQTSVFEGTLDGISWTPFSTAAGTVVSVSGTANRITSTGGTTPVIDISASYVGQSSITTLGTITTGVWNGTAIDLASYVSGNLAVSHLNSGTSASSTTFWRGDGTWAAALDGTAFHSVVIQTFNSSGTYTPTSGMKYCYVSVTGGGGGGGGTPTSAIGQGAAGGGGGSGATSTGVFSAATIGASQAVTIGAGGTGVANAAGNNGSASSLGALLTANGGSGGSNAASTAGTVGVQGGAGGTAGSGGSSNIPGSAGQISLIVGTTQTYSGNGASSSLGGGTLTRVASGGSAAGFSAVANSGAGGSGSAIQGVTGTTQAGGNGGSGQITIIEYVA